MVTADVSVSELEVKNRESFRNLVATRYLPALASEGLSVADTFRWECKMMPSQKDVRKMAQKLDLFQAPISKQLVSKEAATPATYQSEHPFHLDQGDYEKSICQKKPHR